MIRWKLLSAIAVMAALASFAALGGGLRWSARTVPADVNQVNATVAGNPS